MSAMGSDLGTGLAICPCPVMVCHFFGKQALPLSSHSSFEQEVGLGGLNLEVYELQVPFCRGSQSTYSQDGETLGGGV